MALPLTRFVAIDCEMVSLRQSDDALALARVAVVDHEGAVLLDSHVHVPHATIRNYNTKSSGIRPGELEAAPKLEEVRKKVREIVRGKVVVGHALFNDLAVLQMRLPVEKTRDTALYYPLRSVLNVKSEGQYPGLKRLSMEVLGEEIQGASHCPIIDATTAMKLYLHYRDAWETAISKDEDVTACIPGHFSEWYH